MTSAVNVDYGWALTDRFHAYVSGTWSHVGNRFSGFTPSATLVSHVALGSYDTGSLRAGLEDNRYSFEVFINNVSDTRAVTYYESSGGADFTGQASFIQPRTIGAVARVKF